MSPREPIVIRSYRRIFNVERRIYKVDKWTIPVPGGIELRAVVYFIGSLLLILFLTILPLIGDALALLGWQYKFVIFPLAVAVFGTRVTPDGRPAHRYMFSLIGYVLRRHRVAGAHAAPLEDEPIPYEPDVWIVPDSRAPELRRARVKGPAVVYFRDQVVADVPTGSRFQRRRRIRPSAGRRPRKRQEITDNVAVKAGETVEITP